MELLSGEGVICENTMQEFQKGLQQINSRSTGLKDEGEKFYKLLNPLPW